MKSFTPLRTIAIALGLFVATTAQGQRPQSSSQVVPPNLRPPAGMCRVWVNGVPPERQPAPTDCASALRNRPSNGRVIFGDDYAPNRPDESRADGQPLKGLAPLPKSLEPKPADARKADDTKKPDDAGKKKGDPRKPAPGGHKPDSSAVSAGNGGPVAPER
ncbi:MAG: hypothetical protein KGL38_14545 [Gemmatimonadota bacterium]|nr:hypothetical protein [Gemmatimonadota bacterium]